MCKGCFGSDKSSISISEGSSKKDLLEYGLSIVIECCEMWAVRCGLYDDDHWDKDESVDWLVVRVLIFWRSMGSEIECNSMPKCCVIADDRGRRVTLNSFGYHICVVGS